MNSSEFAVWLEGYREAWETRSPEAAVALFTGSATYQETPYDIPMMGEKEIYEYWAEVPKSQNNITFRWQILAVNGSLGIAQWQASFKRFPEGVQVALDGILTADFDEAGRCQIFKEWWHRREE
jgi:hypothetical protein